MMDVQGPNFLILGAYKAGTTSLYYYLRQHPQIYLPTIKELRFLTYAGHQMGNPTLSDLRATPWPVKTPTAYAAHFAQAQAHNLARGDISPCYLAYPEPSILGIQQYAPLARMVVLLRQPVDRAYSSFLYLVRQGWEDVLDFRAAVRLEQAGDLYTNNSRLRRNLADGFYFRQLSHYYRAFSANQILVLLYDEWQHDAQGALQQIFRFLEVEPTFTPDLTQRHNQAAWPRSQGIHRWLQQPNPIGLRRLSERWRIRIKAKLNRLNRTVAPPLDPALRQELTHYFREDILQLQALLDKDLTDWLVN